MTALPRRQQNRLDRERRILDAALKVFAGPGLFRHLDGCGRRRSGADEAHALQYFPSKESLFQAMMLGKRDVMLDVFDPPLAAGHGADLWSFAWDYADTVMRPDMLSLARLIIGEVQRFPEIGRAYQASGPDHLLRGIMRYLTASATTAGWSSTMPNWQRRTCGA